MTAGSIFRGDAQLRVLADLRGVEQRGLRHGHVARRYDWGGFVHRRYRSTPKPSERDRAVITTESSGSATIAAEALYHTKASEVLHNADCQHLQDCETIEQKVCKDCRRRGR